MTSRLAERDGSRSLARREGPADPAQAGQPGVSQPAGGGSPNATRNRIRMAGREVSIRPHNCFACGTLNSHGLRLALHAEDGRCWTRLSLAPRFEGWDGIAHGGIVCTILDEVMAWALIETDAWGVTARLNVQFRRPIPIGRPIVGEGRVVEVRRRLMTTAGQITDAADGAVLAEAEGVYVAAPPERKAELKARYAFRLVDSRDGTPAREAGR